MYISFHFLHPTNFKLWMKSTTANSAKAWKCSQMWNITIHSKFYNFIKLKLQSVSWHLSSLSGSYHVKIPQFLNILKLLNILILQYPTSSLFVPQCLVPQRPSSLMFNCPIGHGHIIKHSFLQLHWTNTWHLSSL